MSNVRRKIKNNQGVIVPGLTEKHIKRIFQNHRNELAIGRRIARKYNNIQGVVLIDNMVIALVYDAFTGETHVVSCEFISIPVRSAEDFDPRQLLCSCYQVQSAISLCQHAAAMLVSTEDRYFTTSTFLPYDPFAFKVFITKNNTILYYEIDDVIIHQSELAASPHPQNIFTNAEVAKVHCNLKMVCLLIIIYSGNASCKAPFCPYCDLKYKWVSKIYSFEHFCKTSQRHYTKSIFKQSSIFANIDIVVFFKSMLLVAEDRSRKTWRDIENNHGVGRKTMSKNFHKMAAVATIVMKHCVPVSNTQYKAAEFDAANLGKRKSGKGRRVTPHWAGRLNERMNTIKGGRLQFSWSGGHESVENYGGKIMDKSSVYMWLYTDTSGLARSHFIRYQRRNETTNHSIGEFSKHKHSKYPFQHKAHPQGTEQSWVNLKTQRRLRHGLGYKQDEMQPQFWLNYFDFVKTFTDKSAMDVVIVFLTHLGIIWNFNNEEYGI